MKREKANIGDDSDKTQNRSSGTIHDQITARTIEYYASVIHICLFLNRS